MAFVHRLRQSKKPVTRSKRLRGKRNRFAASSDKTKIKTLSNIKFFKNIIHIIFHLEYENQSESYSFLYYIPNTSVSDLNQNTSVSDLNQNTSVYTKCIPLYIIIFYTVAQYVYNNFLNLYRVCCVTDYYFYK